MSWRPSFREAFRWIAQSPRRRQVLLALRQPITARQLASHLGLTRDQCSRAFGDLNLYRLVDCLNPGARASRLYWLTSFGEACQRRLARIASLQLPSPSTPEIDWHLYGWVCYSHRSAVIKTLTRPLQPAAIKRQACFNDPHLRMSANNVRDIIRLFEKRGIVRPLYVRKSRHPRYELTPAGLALRQLLQRADSHPFA